MFASARGTLVGGVMGLLPGMVPALTAYVAYDVERRVSRHGKELGSGAIEGVASPEAANNATAMTGFIPLLSLGIPTSPALAIVLGTLIMNGLQPGPQLFVKNGDFVFTVIGAMLIGNTILLVLSLPLVRFWAGISIVPYRVLAPIILAICVIGAFAPRNALSDVYVALMFGGIGYVMRRLDWPMSPLILGFLLGPLFEQSFRQSMGLSSGDLSIFLSRPISAACIIAAAVVIVFTTWMKRRKSMMARLVAESANEV
jgi:putative tricarboxylic transport membrane protein